MVVVLLLIISLLLLLVLVLTPESSLLSFSIDGEMSSAGRLDMVANEEVYLIRVGYVVIIYLLLVLNFCLRGRICHLQSCVDEYEVLWCLVK